MQFYISSTLTDASPEQAEMLRMALWTKAAHAEMNGSRMFSCIFSMKQACVCVCVRLSELIPTDDPPLDLMGRILHQLVKIDMQHDHGRSKHLQNVKCPRSILRGLYTKRRDGIGGPTTSPSDVVHDMREIAATSV
eukprot:3015532-Amphidinium_carterae.2